MIAQLTTALDLRLQSAMNAMVDHLDRRKAVLTKIFRDFDSSGSGSIDRAELRAGLRALGLAHGLGRALNRELAARVRHSRPVT